MRQQGNFAHSSGVKALLNALQAWTPCGRNRAGEVPQCHQSTSLFSGRGPEHKSLSIVKIVFASTMSAGNLTLQGTSSAQLHERELASVLSIFLNK
eukprot:1158039-Pelagomonas_calceolata.AAC.6